MAAVLPLRARNAAGVRCLPRTIPDWGEMKKKKDKIDKIDKRRVRVGSATARASVARILEDCG
jgi:hypothetical protein